MYDKQHIIKASTYIHLVSILKWHLYNIQQLYHLREGNYDTDIRSIKMLFLRINKQIHIFEKLGPLFRVNLEWLLILFITNICFILKDWNTCCTPLFTSAQKQHFSNLTLYGDPKKLDASSLVYLILYYFILWESMHSKKDLLFLVTEVQVTLRWHILCLQVYLSFFSYVLSGNDVLF